MGRSYECVFCKRGFTTAQALGGHMNIHRKDRPSATKPNKPITTSANHSYRSTNYDYGFHQSSFPLHHYPSRPAAHAFFPTAGVGEAHLYVQAPPAYLDLFGEDSWRIRSGDQSKDKDYEVSGAGEGDGLDLELRLGHHHGGGRQY
ncbi:Transcriptional regulator TAC1 [Linum grandiflorum]